MLWRKLLVKVYFEGNANKAKCGYSYLEYSVTRVAEEWRDSIVARRSSQPGKSVAEREKISDSPSPHSKE